MDEFAGKSQALGDLIAARFNEELPPNQRWYYRYFQTPVERQFVRYFLLFQNTVMFTDHTGHDASRRWLRTLKERFRKLESVYKQARANLDTEMVAKIETGKYEDFYA